jgi:parallel beta-helix repeat protein
VRRKLADLPPKERARSERGRAERIRLFRQRRRLGGATQSAIRVAATSAVAIVAVAAPSAAATFDGGSGPSAPAQNLAGAGGPASASQVSCGEVITADTTLDADLVDCPGNGIVIAADGVTLDLNGHTIDGDGELVDNCPGSGPCNFGVINDGHDRVTVRDGSVREFATGVAVFSARGNRVVDISSSRHDFFGLVLGGADRSVVRQSSLSRNIAPNGDGIGLFVSDHIRIVDNEIRKNPGPGIHVAFHSSDNLIKGNLFYSNGPGILIESGRNEVRRNRIVRDAIAVRSDRNVVARNRASEGNIAIEKGRGNLVAHNVVGGGRGAGIRLGFDQVGGANNVVRRNLVRASRGDGFVVAEGDNHSLLKRNVAIGAGDDGFDVNNSSAKLTRNQAAGNSDLGIEAVAGVNDGGGNRASGNGNPAQCTHVACK